MDDYSYAVVQKCGLLLLPFVERSRDLVIKNLLITDDKSRFI